MRSSITTSVTALVALSFFTACDRREASNSTPSAPQTASTPSPADLHVNYRTAVQPLVDQLTRVQSLIETPASLDFPELEKQAKESNFLFQKAEDSVKPDDKRRESYLRMAEAVRSFNRSYQLEKSVQNIGSTVQPTPPPPYPHPRDADEFEANSRHLAKYDTTAAVIAAMGQVSKVKAESPKALADCLLQIMDAKRLLNSEGDVPPPSIQQH